ncbi:mercury methylation corrinoid protein HgcA [Thermodesulfobacteriota bacterium]
MTDTPKCSSTDSFETLCSSSSGVEPELQPLFTDSSNTGDTISCCGVSSKPDNTLLQRPGYALWHFVEEIPETPSGPVPRVKTDMQWPDILGTIKTRIGIGRDTYSIAPGLYCVGNPGSDDPVLVTANYKLSFDALRKELAKLNAWILVLDTKGVNVWCAAGKKTFSTQEVIQRVTMSGLDKLVHHKELILPQLSATGVAAHLVKKECGFKVIWGPVQARDIKRFLEAGKKADSSMRRVTFSLIERLVLIPVELSFLPKPTLWVLLAIFILSGIGSNIFSFSVAWHRGVMAFTAYLAGVFAGAVVAPALLPWIPGRAFCLKGIETGLIAGLGVAVMFWNQTIILETVVLLLFTMAVSSYLAMNFTGSTPFTSPSGVEKEMRTGIPVQAGTVVIAVIAWITSAFIT